MSLEFQTIVKPQLDAAERTSAASDHSEICYAKEAVLQAALGIQSLSEADLLVRLEKLYWRAFKAGSEQNWDTPVN